MLYLLKNYRLSAAFPKNYDYPGERKPCFIDRDGRICAVGYLIEQTAGRQAAEEINGKFQYEYLLAMNDKTIDEWIAASGLTKEECAMIQPSYQPLEYTYISKGYGISSALVSGLNVLLNTLNGIQIARGSNSNIVPVTGLLAGAVQITLGALSYPEDPAYGYSNLNADKKNLSLLNIGLGTSTMLLSTLNLITNKKRKNKSLVWDVYSFPDHNRQTGIGLILKKTF